MDVSLTGKKNRFENFILQKFIALLRYNLFFIFKNRNSFNNVQFSSVFTTFENSFQTLSYALFTYVPQGVPVDSRRNHPRTRFDDGKQNLWPGLGYIIKSRTCDDQNLAFYLKNSLKAPAFIITQGNIVQISLISNETKRPLNAKRNFLLEIQPTDGKFRNILKVELDLIHLRILYYNVCL